MFGPPGASRASLRPSWCGRVLRASRLLAWSVSRRSVRFEALQDRGRLFAGGLGLPNKRSGVMGWLRTSVRAARGPGPGAPGSSGSGAAWNYALGALGAGCTLVRLARAGAERLFARRLEVLTGGCRAEPAPNAPGCTGVHADSLRLRAPTRNLQAGRQGATPGGNAGRETPTSRRCKNRGGRPARRG